MPFGLTIFTRKWTLKNIAGHRRTLCFIVMHHAKRSSSKGQAVLVLRIFDLESRNPHEQARLSINENLRQKAGARNMPGVAQGRAQGA
jgi:hypothetical protein